MATVADISPVVVKPAAVLASLYTHLGRNSKLGLSGRSNPDIGILTTSKVWNVSQLYVMFKSVQFLKCWVQ